MKVKKKYVVYIFLFILLTFLFVIIPHTALLNQFLAIETILFSIVWIYKCWNNMYLLIVSTFIAYSNYSIAVGIYLDESSRPKYLYPQIQNVDIYSVGIFLMFLTMLSLAILSPKCKKNTINIAKEFVKLKNKNDVVFFALMILFIGIVVLGYSRASNSRGSSTAIYEYASILIILMFYFSGGKKIQKNICAVCCLVYALTSLLNGTRIEALICVIIFVLCYFENEINPVVLLMAMLLGLIAFSIVGTLRGNWALLKGNVGELAGILAKNKFVFDTCTHAYFPMLCMIDIYRKYSFLEAMHYLITFVLTIFLGQSRVNDGNLIQVVSNYFYHNFGGVSQGFFFVWFSYVGALIYAVVILAYTRFISDRKVTLTPVKCSAIIYIVASVPRWYLYGPWSLFRGVLICVIFTKVTICCEKTIQRKG